MSGPARRRRGPATGSTSPEPGGLKQASLARLADFAVVPKRRLGQNFLIDDNILSVILARLESQPDDVVLEVGAGLGVLTRALAEHSARVHAFEIDRSLEAPLRATLGALAGKVELHLADVLQSPLEELSPPATLCASNLPYAPAAPFLAEALGRLPGVRRYVVMVQREIAERIAAHPGSKTYGSLSVWIQLHARIVEVRPLSRAIFHPRPNVDSSLLTLERRPPDSEVARLSSLLRRTIDAAFAQRRKAVANALSAGLGLGKEEVIGMLASVGVAAGQRAEQLSPVAFLEIASALDSRSPVESRSSTG